MFLVNVLMAVVGMFGAVEEETHMSSPSLWGLDSLSAPIDSNVFAPFGDEVDADSTFEGSNGYIVVHWGTQDWLEWVNPTYGDGMQNGPNGGS